MKKGLIIILFMAFFQSLSAQTDVFTTLINEGDNHFRGKNYIKAFELFVKAKEKAVNTAQSNTAEARAEQSRKAIIQQQADLQKALTKAETALRKADELQQKVERAAFDIAVRKKFPQWIGFDTYFNEIFKYDTVFIQSEDGEVKPMPTRQRKGWNEVSEEIALQDSILWVLDTLVFAENSLTRLPDEIMYCLSIKAIDLIQCPNFSWKSSEITLLEMTLMNKNVGIFANYCDFEDIEPDLRHFLKGAILVATDSNQTINDILLQQKQLQSLQFVGFKKIDSLSNFSKVFSLENLEHLDLQDCGIGNLPAGIENLKRLKTLNLGRNNLRTIPREVGNLKYLQALKLNNNALGDIPKEVSGLTNLETLDISGNSISELSFHLANFQRLKSLNISGNQLRKLPDSLTELKNLLILDISENKISQLPADLVKLEKLENLNLSDNDFREIPGSIFQLLNLRDLNLRSLNCYSSLRIDSVYITVDSGFIWQVVKFREWEDPHTIENIPEGIGKLKKLQHLNLSDIGLYSLPNELGNLTEITTLDISGNDIVDFPYIISNLGHLKNIEIDDYKLKFDQVPDNIFSLNLNGIFFTIIGKMLMDTANYQQALRAFKKAIDASTANVLWVNGLAAICAEKLHKNEESELYYHNLTEILQNQNYLDINMKRSGSRYYFFKEQTCSNLLHVFNEKKCYSLYCNFARYFHNEYPGYNIWDETSKNCLFAGNPASAVDAANLYLHQFPENSSVKIYQTLGYLLDANWNVAERIIRECQGQKLTGTDGTFNELLLQTMSSLETIGITHPDFQKVREMLSN